MGRPGAAHALKPNASETSTMTILVIAEHDHASVKGATLHTVTAAVACGAGDVHVLVAGHNAGEAAKAAAQIAGVTKVLHAEGEHLAHGLAENVAAQVLAVAGAYSHILFPATPSGKNIAPRVAAKLDVGQLSDVSKVDSPDTFERPIYAGNAIATVQSADATKVSTVRTTGFDAAAATGGSAGPACSALISTRPSAARQPCQAWPCPLKTTISSAGRRRSTRTA